MKLKLAIFSLAIFVASSAISGPSIDDYTLVYLGSSDEKCEALITPVRTGANTSIKGESLEAGKWCVVSLSKSDFSKKFEMCSLSGVKNFNPKGGGCDLNFASPRPGKGLTLIEFAARTDGEHAAYHCEWICKNASEK